MSLYGACDQEVSQQLEQKCEEEIMHRTSYIFFDCGGISSFSPHALRGLLHKSAKADKAGIQLVLYQLSAAHVTIMKHSGPEAVLHLAPTFKDAYLYCKAQAAAKKRNDDAL